MTQDSVSGHNGEAAARKAIVPDPRSARAYFELAMEWGEDPARVAEAESAFRRAIELEPANPRYVYRLGLWLHEHTLRSGAAEAAYRRAIELAPNDAFVYGGLVSLLVQQGRRIEALSLGASMRALLGASRNSYGLAT